jgi:phenylacetate-CoA ligase
MSVSLTWAVDRVRSEAADAAALRRLHPNYRQSLRALFRLQELGLVERRQWEDGRLRCVCAWAQRTQYGKSLRGRAIREWPLVEKESIRQNPSAYSGPFGFSATTGGSTGVPLLLRRSLASAAAEQAAVDYILARAGIPASQARIAVLRASSLGRDAEGQHVVARAYGKRRLLLSPQALDQSRAAEYAAALKSFRPDVLMAYPSSALSLSEVLSAGRMAASIPVVLTSSETLQSGARQVLQARFSALVVDLYGMGERVAMAYSLRDGEYWFLPGYGVVDLVASSTAADSSSYDVVGTTLWNSAMPLVRYRTGDVVELGGSGSEAEIAAVAAGVAPFKRVLGRVTDYVVLPGGAHAIGMNHIPWGVERVIQMQVVQHEDLSVTVEVLPDAGYGAKDEGLILSNARTAVSERLNVRVEVVTALRTLHNGKTPFVLRESECTRTDPPQ